jgi:four helix bundle protein
MVEYKFSFEKLIAWQKAKELIKTIYKITNQFPSSENYNLISQAQRASISISSNLAEGSSRDTPNDKKRFITISYSSLMELYSILLVSKELGYISLEDFLFAKNQIIELSKILNGLKKSF